MTAEIHILVVDDNQDNRELMSRRLKQREYAVTMAEDGEQALNLIGEKSYDLVLLDIMMPGVSGTQVLEAVRLGHSPVELPIIMVTAKHDSENLAESLALGANDYVTKPIDYRILFARIEAQLALKRAEAELHELNRTLEQKVERRTRQYEETFIRLTEEIEERKNAEQAILRREQRFRDFSEVASDWFWETDSHHKLTYVSERIGEILGVSPDQAVGKTIRDLGPADSTRRPNWDVLTAKMDARAEFKSVSLEFPHPDGRTLHVRLSGKPVYGDGGGFTGYRGTSDDETAEVEIRARARKVEDLMVDITRSLPCVIYRMLQWPDGRIEYPFVSSVVENLIGLDHEAVMRGGFMALQAIHADDLDAYQEAMAISAQALSPLNIEYRIVHAEGGIKWIHCSAYPERMDSGAVAWDGLLLDVTDRKNLESQLRQAQKLEAVGQLAAGIAHEINTPTQFASDNMRFLQEAFGDFHQLISQCLELQKAVRCNTGNAAKLVETIDSTIEAVDLEYLEEEIPKACDQTIEGLKRIANIVGAMKQFTHPGGGDRESVDLHEIINNSLTVASNEWKYVASSEIDFASDLPLIPCYRGPLGQVFLNLIVNAAHAIGEVAAEGSCEKGVISISTRRLDRHAEIRVSDTGPGIPQAVAGKIFDPFFTTKDVGKGTGQGLAIAHSIIVDKHGGDLYLESKPEDGATFIIRLPLHDSDQIRLEASA